MRRRVFPNRWGQTRRAGSSRRRARRPSPFVADITIGISRIGEDVRRAAARVGSPTQTCCAPAVVHRHKNAHENPAKVDLGCSLLRTSKIDGGLAGHRQIQFSAMLMSALSTFSHFTGAVLVFGVRDSAIGRHEEFVVAHVCVVGSEQDTVVSCMPVRIRFCAPRWTRTGSRVVE